MELIIKRMVARNKKFFLLLIAFPVVLGVLGWVLPVGKEPSLYTAEAKISLGNYDYQDLNDPKKVIILLTTAPFYQDNLTGLSEEKQNEIVSKIQVTAVTDSMIKLSYTDYPKESSIQIVNGITRAFLKMDQQRFQEKKKVIQGSIDALKQVKVSKDVIVEEQRFLYKLNTDRLDIKPAHILQLADEREVMIENKALSSKERAVLGVLLGITFTLLWISIPELVREQSY